MAFPSPKVPATVEALTFAAAYAERDEETAQEALAAAGTSVYTRLAFATNLAALAMHLAGGPDRLLEHVDHLRAELHAETDRLTIEADQ